MTKREDLVRCMHVNIAVPIYDRVKQHHGKGLRIRYIVEEALTEWLDRREAKAS